MKDGKEIAEGDLVLLLDDNLPRGLWSMGRITKIITGDDGHICTVEVKTPRSTYLRPAAKVCAYSRKMCEFPDWKPEA